MYLGDSGRADILCVAGILAALLLECRMSPWLGKQPAASGISNGMRLYVPDSACGCPCLQHIICLGEEH